MKTIFQYLTIILILSVASVEASQPVVSSPQDTVIVNRYQIDKYQYRLNMADFIILYNLDESTISGKFIKLIDSLMVIQVGNTYQTLPLSDVRKIVTFSKSSSAAASVVVGVMFGGGLGMALAAGTQESEPPPPHFDTYYDEENQNSQERQQQQSERQRAESQYQREKEAVRSRNASRWVFYPVMGASIGALLGSLAYKKDQLKTKTVFLFADNLSTPERRQAGLIQFQGQWLTSRQKADYKNRGLVFFDGHWMTPELMFRLKHRASARDSINNPDESPRQADQLVEQLVEYGNELILVSELNARGGALDDFHHVITRHEIETSMKASPPFITPEAYLGVTGAAMAAYQLHHSRQTISSTAALMTYGAVAAGSFIFSRVLAKFNSRERAIQRIKRQRRRFYEQRLQRQAKFSRLKISPTLNLYCLNQNPNELTPLLGIAVSY